MRFTPDGFVELILFMFSSWWTEQEIRQYEKVVQVAAMQYQADWTFFFPYFIQSTVTWTKCSNSLNHQARCVKNAATEHKIFGKKNQWIEPIHLSVNLLITFLYYWEIYEFRTPPKKKRWAHVDIISSILLSGTWYTHRTIYLMKF